MRKTKTGKQAPNTVLKQLIEFLIFTYTNKFVVFIALIFLTFFKYKIFIDLNPSVNILSIFLFFKAKNNSFLLLKI